MKKGLMITLLLLNTITPTITGNASSVSTVSPPVASVSPLVTQSENEPMLIETSASHESNRNSNENITVSDKATTISEELVAPEQANSSTPLQDDMINRIDSAQSDKSPEKPDEKSIIAGSWDNASFFYDTDKKKMDITGGFVYDVYNAPWKGTYNDVKEINFTGKLYIMDTDLYNMFSNLQDLTTVNGMRNIDVSVATSMRMTFYNCSKLKEIDFTGWDTRKVRDFSSMLSGCKSLEKITFDRFDISYGQDFTRMFFNCNALTTLDISNWAVKENAEINTGEMMTGLIHLKSLTVPNGSQLTMDTPLAIIDTTPEYTGKWVNSSDEAESYSTKTLLGTNSREAGTYVWQKNRYSLTVKYLNNANNEIHDSQTMSGLFNETYDATTPEFQLMIPGYTLNGVPTNAKGQFKSGLDPVKYVYTPFMKPMLNTVDTSFYIGESYDDRANFVSGTDHLGQTLSWGNPALHVGGDVIDPTKVGIYHKTLTYSFENAETVTSSYTVTVLEDQTAAQLQDVKLYVGDTFDANAPFKQVVDKEGQAIDAKDVYKYFIDEVETRKLNTKTAGEHTVRLQLQTANGDVIDSNKPDAIVKVKEDETSIVAKNVELYIGDTYHPEDGFVSATNADGESLPYSDEMSWIANNAIIDTSVAGNYIIIYGVPDHSGKIIKTMSEVIVKDPALEIDVTIPTAMLFANTENSGLSKKIASSDYTITNNSTEKGVNIELVSFKGAETNQLILLDATEDDPLVESDSLRLNLKVDGIEVINSLSDATTATSLGTIAPEDKLLLSFDGEYFGSTAIGVKTTINHEMELKFNLISD